ncbi:hypothetical protein V6N13_023308 [Hibiscus sabdariffa]|uniref:Uncharacterized protein n=2 Tax=Hibiscus sabdariffa TaxID=183260 RepID=A0ABR2PLE0_9ROSI
MGNFKGVALQLLLVFSLLHLSFAKINWFYNYHIHIRNDLPLPMLKGQDYTWDTKINFLHTTLFFCNARWVGRKRMSFDAFTVGRDEQRCLHYHNSCMWSVREDGIYFSQNNATWEYSYRW